MQTTFQKLCIRPDVGFAYDKKAMVDLADGGSFTELLCKITSKCDTSILLLSSHKGVIRDFAVKLIGIQSPQSQSVSVTSAVLSGFKKGLSYLNGSGANTCQAAEPVLDDIEQVAEAWAECQASGYHGMQVLTLIDKDVMPDNECRKLYTLHQFVTIILQSINAYYMFQKPDVAFVFDADFSTQQLKEAYPNADNFGVALMWRFAENPVINSGRIRPTPIIKTSIRADPVPSPRGSRLSIFSDRLTTPGRSMSTTTTTTTSFTSSSRKLSNMRDSPVLSRQTASPAVSRPQPRFQPTNMEEEDEEEEEEASYSSRDNSPRRPPIPSPAQAREQTPLAPKLFSPVKASLPIPPAPFIITSPERLSASEAAPAVPEKKPMSQRKTKEIVSEITNTTSRRTVSNSAAPVQEVKVPSVRKVRGTPKRRRQEEEEEEDDQISDSEVSFKPSGEIHGQQMEEPPMDVDDMTALGNTSAAPPERTMIDLQSSINLPFDDTPTTTNKTRGGRKSMVASARKSLANEWPAADKDHMLHFYDNLNPDKSETSRVALTCKYALLQFDRDLSSKLLYQWLEVKGRLVKRQVTEFTLKEADQKSTVLDLYRSLSQDQSESTRASFTLKFIQSQYGVSVTSKQLFAWLKEKPTKKAKK